MKKVLFTFSPLLCVLFIISCSELLDPTGSADRIISGGTKSPSQEYYYWCKGERIELKLNMNYVNLLVDTTRINESNLADLCLKYGLEVKTKINNNGIIKAQRKGELIDASEFENYLQNIRKDERILYVFPFFESLNGKELIGSSQRFYVQLKEISPKETTYFEKSFDLNALIEESEKYGVQIIKEVAYMPDWYIMSIEGSIFETSLEAANIFYESGRFEKTDPAFIISVEPCTTNDPMFSLQWGLKNNINTGYDINIEGAWEVTEGNGAKIAIVDNDIDPNHDDLSSNLSLYSYDVSTGMPCSNTNGLLHGTMVAGIAGAIGNNNLQIAGVAYGAEIMRVRIVYGPGGSSSDNLASGISWAWQNGADVINCSWKIDTPGDLLLNAIDNAMTYGRTDKGCVVVFASGNYGVSSISSPGSDNDRILTVGSINYSGYRSVFSNYGTKLDVVAPGENILSLAPYNDTYSDSGTSFAAPHVAGVAALVLASNSYLSGDNAVSIIQRTAKKISPGNPYTYTYYPRDYMFDNETWNQEVGYGLVDATAAVSMANAFQGTPSLNGTGMDVTLSTGPTNNNQTYTINGGPFPITAYASLLYPQQNSSYTYYWFVSTNAYPTWNPSLTMTSGSMAIINIPALSYPCILYIQCMIYNGSTLVDIPSYTINVNP